MKSATIQNLRGICALMVFLSHSLLMYRNEVIGDLYHSPLHFFFDGAIAVNIFFAISGFFYYKNEELSAKKYVKGLFRKTIKIYPPPIFWFCCLAWFYAIRTCIIQK